MFFLKFILSTLIILININSISKAETLTFPTNLVANTTNFVLLSTSGTTPAISGYSGTLLFAATASAGNIKVTAWRCVRARNGLWHQCGPPPVAGGGCSRPAGAACLTARRHGSCVRHSGCATPPPLRRAASASVESAPPSRHRGSEANASSPHRFSVEDKLKEIVAEQLGVEQSSITPEASFASDLGADSLDVVEMVMKIEEEFNVELPDERAEEVQNLSDAVRVVTELTA